MKNLILGSFFTAALIIAGTTTTNAQTKTNDPTLVKPVKTKQVAKAKSVKQVTKAKSNVTVKTAPKATNAKTVPRAKAATKTSNAKTVPKANTAPKTKVNSKSVQQKSLKRVTKKSVQAKPAVQPKMTNKK